MRHDTIASFFAKKNWPKFSLTGVLHPGDDRVQEPHNVVCSPFSQHRAMLFPSSNHIGSVQEQHNRDSVADVIGLSSFV